MHRFHFVHAAGLRLDQPFAGIGRVPPAIRDCLCAAATAAWDDLVDFCVRREPAFLVLVGGMFGPDADSLASRSRLQRGLRRLAEHDIRVFIACDGSDGRALDLAGDLRSDEVTLFPADRPQTVLVEHRGEPVALVAGQTATAERPPAAAEYFTDADGGLLRVGVYPGAADRLDAEPDAVRRSAAYWALGDAPEPSRRGFSPWLVQPGALQARSAKPSERGARGAMLVAVDGARVVAVDHSPLDRVRYAELAILPQHGLDAPLLVHQLLDELHRLRAANAGRALLVDVVLENTPPVRFDTADQILERLRAETSAWDPFVWCSHLRAAPPTPSVEQAAGPIGRAVVQQAQALLASPMQRSFVFADHFAPLLQRCDTEIDVGDAEQLIAEATALALRYSGEEAAG